MSTITIKKTKTLLPQFIFNGATNKMFVKSIDESHRPRPSKIKSKIFSGFIASMCLITTSIAYSTPADPAYIIMDNTAGLNNAAIMSNMATNRAPDCSKNDVLINNSQNCFALGDNNIQVVQNDGTGNPVSLIGVANTESSSYENKDTDKQTYLFTPGQHLFDIDGFRTAANNIALLEGSEDVIGTYGTISFEQFLLNIAAKKTMNGIVRVKIPLIENLTARSSSGDDDDSSDDDGSSDNNNNAQQQARYRMCGEVPTAACRLCGPGPNTVLKAGRTICGVTLPNDAQISVNGSLMFDWVNCGTGDAVPIDQFPSNTDSITFGISLPMNINPANINTEAQIMSSVSDIQTITGSGECSGTETRPCSVPIDATIGFDLVPQESRDMYEFKIGSALTQAVFQDLSKSDQYHLLFPSGYANGWSNAFSALGITPAQWNSWGLEAEGDSTAGNVISATSVRRESFGDIPALMYTGGLISIKHHTNISGLIYAAQAIEINQEGIRVSGSSDSSGSFTPSYQYINGSLIVRDGFYFEATQPGGVTIISNNPDTYSNTKLKNQSGTRATFQAYEPDGTPAPTPDDGADTTPQPSDISVLTNAAGSIASNGPEWVEIRAK